MFYKRRASPPPGVIASTSAFAYPASRQQVPLSAPRHAKINIRRSSSFGLPTEKLGRRRSQVLVAVLGAFGILVFFYTIGSSGGDVWPSDSSRGRTTGHRTALRLRELQELRSRQGDAQNGRPVLRPELLSSRSISTHPAPHPPTDEHAKYLAYLPHGGYHSQRIALENALTLAIILNRTLLLPPAWLGKVPPYAPYGELGAFLQKADKRGLKHCPVIPEKTPLPQECHEYFDYTTVGWPFLVELLDFTDEPASWVDRWDFSSDYFTRSITSGGLGVPLKSIYEIKETSRDQYQFYDGEADAAHKGYSEAISIADLQALDSFQIISFGALSGTMRLNLTIAEHRAIKERVLGAMRLVNNDILSTAIRVQALFGEYGGHGFVGVHARLSEPVFQWRAGENMRELFWTLARSLEISDTAILNLEREHWNRNALYRREVSRPQTEEGYSYAKQDEQERWLLDEDSAGAREYPGAPNYLIEVLPERFAHERPLIPPATTLPPPGLTCSGELHKIESLLAFNTPIFLATDISTPSSSPALSIFFSAFPCVFTLSSPEIQEIVKKEIEPLSSSEDSTPLARFLIPFLDATIAARGHQVHGTKGSTFSRFVTDIEGRSVHGWPIVVRT